MPSGSEFQRQSLDQLSDKRLERRGKRMPAVPHDLGLQQSHLNACGPLTAGMTRLLKYRLRRLRNSTAKRLPQILDFRLQLSNPLVLR